MRGFFVGSIVLLASGCFISPQADTSWVIVPLSLPESLEGMARTPVRADSAWDAQDRFHLKDFPRLIRAAVEVADYEVASASWPSRPKSEATAWEIEGEAKQPMIALELPAGEDRRITALAYDSHEDGVTVYQAQESIAVDLQTGTNQTATLQMVPAPTGHASIALRCRETMYRPYLKAVLSLVDARAQVVLPPRALAGYAPNFTTLLWKYLPLHRPFRAQVVLSNELTLATQVIELFAPTFTITDTNEFHGLKLEIPCDL